MGFLLVFFFTTTRFFGGTFSADFALSACRLLFRCTISCVLELSRLGRSLPDLIKITDELQAKKVGLVILKENIDTSTPTGRMIFYMLAVIAQFERETILERQREGIELAKLRHAYKGRQPRTLPENFDYYYCLWLARSMSRSQIARELKISRPVLLKLMRQYEEQIKKESAMETSQTKAGQAV